jgi:hypothetical protein
MERSRFASGMDAYYFFCLLKGKIIEICRPLVTKNGDIPIEYNIVIRASQGYGFIFTVCFYIYGKL